MITFLAVAALANQPDLAFVARYYKQGKARSTYRLYLARHDGKRQTLAPGAPDNLVSLTWVDHNTLALTTEEKDKSGVYTYNVTTRVSKRIGTVGVYATFVADDGGQDFLESDGKAFHVVKGKLAEIPYPTVSSFFGAASNENEPNPVISGTVTLKSGSTLKLAYQRELEDDGDFDLSMSIGDKTTKVKLKGIRIDKVVPEDKTFLAVTDVPFHKAFRGGRLYRIDPVQSKADLLVDEVGMIELARGSSFWSACQAEGMPMTKLKDGRQVYTNWLYTGDWKTGQKWTVATGLVNVARAVFRP